MVNWTLVAVALVLAAVYFSKLRKWFRWRRLMSAIPEAPGGNWLTGHSAAFADRLRVGERRLEWRKLNSRVYKYGTGLGSSQVNVVCPETAADVFRSLNMPKEEFFYGLLRPWLGDGLLTSNGRKWARDRRMLTSCFHFDILRSYTDVYTDAVAIMLDKWAEVASTGESIDVTQSCTMLTLDIILRCAMGFESNCQTETDTEEGAGARYADAVVKLSHAMMDRGRNILHLNDFIYFNFTHAGKQFLELVRTTHDMSQHIIQERRAVLEEETESAGAGKKYRDFLDVLLTVRDEDGIGLTDEEIREQVDTFLFRGHDTTASALQWNIYYLAQNEDLQEQCRQEVLTVLSSGQDDGQLGSVTHDKLSEMQYTTQFIKETLRMASPVPFIGRETAGDFTVDNYELPVGTPIELPIFDLHWAEEHWPEPGKFDPDRFSPQQSKGRHPFAFVPFSAGPRNCVGQAMAMDELKTATALILTRFRIRPDPFQPAPKWVPAMISRASPNIKVCLSPLDDCGRTVSS